MAVRWLIVTDIHGNLPALEAVLDTPEARSCDRIISLGDHVNFGPQPREVQLRLEALGAVLLLGNHEERLSRLDSDEFSGYNWNILKWTARQLDGLRTDFPRDYRIGSVLCTHGTPGNPYHLVDVVSVRPVLDALPADVRVLLSGHNHTRWHVTHGGRAAFNPGSLGIWECGEAGCAPFGVMDIDGDDVQLAWHRVPYDVRRTAYAFAATGCAASSPEMTRVLLHVMQTSCSTAAVSQLFDGVARAAEALGVDEGDAAAWHAADRAFDWWEPIPTDEFWRQVEREGYE